MVALSPAIAQPKKLLTAAEALHWHSNEQPTELVNGEIIYIEHTGEEHADIVGEVFSELRAYVCTHDLGKVFTADAGFLLKRDPDTVRVPDVAFISWLRRGRVAYNTGVVPMAPELAVEVVSPSDRMSEVREKIQEYFIYGVKEVWLIEPAVKTITKYLGSLLHTQILGTDDTLDGGVLLPGFALRVVNLFKV